MVGVMYLKPAREVAKDSTYQTLYVQTDEAGRPQAYFLCSNIPSVEVHGLQCSYVAIDGDVVQYGTYFSNPRVLTHFPLPPLHPPCTVVNNEYAVCPSERLPLNTLPTEVRNRFLDFFNNVKDIVDYLMLARFINELITRFYFGIQ